MIGILLITLGRRGAASFISIMYIVIEQLRGNIRALIN